MALLTAGTMTACVDEYDDTAIWGAVEDVKNRVADLEAATVRLNGDLAALQQLVSALEKQVTITSVEESAEGYRINFSDGSSATITHGKDGENGADGSDGKDGMNAPVISVKQDADGRYYWTLDGEWLLDDAGNKICASGLDGRDGEDGADGKDAAAPQVRINEQTKEWEISTDGGQSWQSTGVVAEGRDGKDGTSGSDGEDGSDGAAGDSFFSRVDASGEDFVLFVLTDGTEILVPRYNASSEPLFIIEGIEQTLQVEYGKCVELSVEAENVADYSISKPDGWRVGYQEGLITVTAPVKENLYAEKEGVVAFNLLSEAGHGLIVKFEVMAGEWVENIELRTLSFEDGSEKFAPYTITGYDTMSDSYYDHEVSVWSDLIDVPEYGGPLCYGDMGFYGEGRGCDYHWYDEGNTFLATEFPVNYGSQVYWGGGHVVSNYASTDYATYGTYEHQMTVYGPEGAGGKGGSINFGIHYGYIDGSDYNMTEVLPYFYFADGQARIIDHMWVNNSCYAISCYADGNGLTENIGENDYVKIVATGYDIDGNPTESEFFLCNGPEHFVTEWAKWDLTSQGKVVKVEFNILGSSDNGYGFSQPSYFAYDDVAVQFAAEKIFN